MMSYSTSQFTLWKHFPQCSTSAFLITEYDAMDSPERLENSTDLDDVSAEGFFEDMEFRD
jgi:hypothetical protein